ncbi:beta strand repeat-containing protein, partial [Pontimicrobium sp. MEBiC06410]
MNNFTKLSEVSIIDIFDSSTFTDKKQKTLSNQATTTASASNNHFNFISSSMKNFTKFSYGNTLFTKVLLSFLFVISIINVSLAQDLHTVPTCSGASQSGTLIWDSTPTTSSEFNWAAGALSQTLTDISGTGINATITFSGRTDAFAPWNGGSNVTPGVHTDASGGAPEVLEFFSNGYLNSENITITIDFSSPIDAIGFDLYHVNGAGPNGDIFTITAEEAIGGGTIFPTFTSSPTPSYTVNAVGVVDSNNNSTAGNNDQVGVNFASANKISSITLVWGNCSACSDNTVHGSSFSNIAFCAVAPDPELQVTKTANPSGDVNTGDTISYTVEVENIGTVDAQNIEVEDILPAGVTYTGGTAMVTYPGGAPTTGSFTHTFAPLNQTFNSTGLTQSYTVTASDIPAGAIITSYSYDVTVSTTDWLSEISLVGTYPSGSVNGTSFGGDSAGNNVNQTGAGTIAGTPSALGTYTFVWDDPNDFGTNTVNTASFTINYSIPGTTTVAANAPANMVTSGDAITLQPGEIMTVTFDVTVDANASGTLTNTANAIADSMVTPATDTASNNVIGNPCNATTSGNPDNDNDNVSDICDLDNDNDGILDTNELRCDQASIANSTSGSGAFQDQLYFFNWTGADFTDGIHDGDSQTFNLPDGLVITATFSNISNATNAATYLPSDMQTWGGAFIHNLYNTPSSSEALYGADGADVSLRVSFTATKGGLPFPIDLLAIDPESTNTNEDLIYTTNGGNWTLLEQYNGGGVWSGVGTTTLEALDTEPSGGNSIFYSRNATVIDISINPGEREGIAFGVLLICDTDNDGIPDYLDVDSDNDGCNDAIEAGHTDTTPADGEVDGTGYDANGQVTGATTAYTGTNTNVITATQVTVNTAPTNQTELTGDSATFTTTATADSATSYTSGTPVYGTPGNANSGINYQWYIGDPNSGGVAITAGDTNYSGENTNTLTVNDVTGLNGTQYCVLITHDDNICINQVNCATLTVDSLVTVTIADATVNEGAGTVTVPVSIDTVSATDVVVDIVTTTGTAGTSDYTVTTTTVTIPAGSTSVDVVIPITDDAIDEADETFTVDGTVTSGNTANTDPSGTVTITDNDNAPTVTIADATVNEGAGTVTVPVSIDTVSSTDVVVDIVTTTGTAGTSDYTVTTTTVTIPAGSTSVDVVIPITDDAIDEADETFTVDGTVTSGNTANTDPSGTVTITDNDNAPTVTIADATVNEGAGTVTVPVSIDTVSATDVVVDIVTTTGTAGTSDYTVTTTTVTIPAGST